MVGFFCGSFMLFLFCFVMLSCTSVCWYIFSPAGKGLTSWLSFVMSNYDVVTFPLVSWVRCGAWLYWFLIFALFLTFIIQKNLWIPFYLWPIQKDNQLLKKLAMQPYVCMPGYKPNNGWKLWCPFSCKMVGQASDTMETLTIKFHW